MLNKRNIFNIKGIDLFNQARAKRYALR